MKKYLVGFLAGAVFAISATAFADNVKSLVGMKVQAVSSITVDDQTLTGIVVNNKTYAPVRAISESVGYTVSVEGKDVKLSSSELKEQQRQSNIEGLTKGIAEGNERIKTYESLIQGAKEKLNAATTDVERNAAQRTIDMYTEKLKQEQDSLAEAEAQLAKLQSEE